MTVESLSFITGLDVTLPAHTDAKSEGDNHVRLIKSALKASFPSLSTAVAESHVTLNFADGLVSNAQAQTNSLSTAAANRLTQSSTASGSLAGLYPSPELKASGVSAGGYISPNIVIGSNGFVSAAVASSAISVASRNIGTTSAVATSSGIATLTSIELMAGTLRSGDVIRLQIVTTITASGPFDPSIVILVDGLQGPYAIVPMPSTLTTQLVISEAILFLLPNKGTPDNHYLKTIDSPEKYIGGYWYFGGTWSDQTTIGIAGRAGISSYLEKAELLHYTLEILRGQ